MQDVKFSATGGWVQGGILAMLKLMNWQVGFPTLLKYNHMAHWKVIALVNGEIEAVSGPAAQTRPGAHEWIVWQGTAGDKAEALQCAEKADPKVDLEWMRIRYEKDLDIR